MGVQIPPSQQIKKLKFMKYQLELTKKQLATIQEACEFMSRFCTGQLDALPQSFQSYLRKDDEPMKTYFERRDMWLDGLKKAKKAMFPELSVGGSYGIGTKYKEANICYDIYRPILEQFDFEQRLAHPKETKDYYSVYSRPGLTTSEEGRITIKTIE